MVDSGGFHRTPPTSTELRTDRNWLEVLDSSARKLLLLTQIWNMRVHAVQFVVCHKKKKKKSEREPSALFHQQQSSREKTIEIQ